MSEFRSLFSESFRDVFLLEKSSKITQLCFVLFLYVGEHSCISFYHLLSKECCYFVFLLKSLVIFLEDNLLYFNCIQ